MELSTISSLVVFLINIIKGTDGFSSGGPYYTCRNLVPAHINCTQTGPAPYRVDVSKVVAGTITGDHKYSVTLNSLDDSWFRGFICAVSELKDETNHPVGKMSLSSSASSTVEAQLLSCSRSTRDTGITHTSNSDKHKVQFEWSVPPDSTPGQQFKLRCTMVMEFLKCWTNLQTIIIHEPGTTTGIVSSRSNGINGTVGTTSNSTTGIVLTRSNKTTGIVGTTSNKTTGIVGTTSNTTSIVGTSKITTGIVGTTNKKTGIVGTTSNTTTSIVGTTSKMTTGIVGTTSNKTTGIVSTTTNKTTGIVGTTSNKTTGIVGTTTNKTTGIDGTTSNNIPERISSNAARVNPGVGTDAKSVSIGNSPIVATPNTVRPSIKSSGNNNLAILNNGWRGLRRMESKALL